MRPEFRWGVLSLAAVTTLWLVWHAPSRELVAVAAIDRTSGTVDMESQRAPLPRPPTPRSPVARMADAPDTLPAREALGKQGGPVFGPQSWAPPPQPAPIVVAPPPPPPPAPAMPYKFAGHLQHDGALQVYLTKGDTILTVRVGETLEGGYRVDKIAPSEITLTYLALDLPQRIPVVTAFDLGADAPAPKAVAQGAAPTVPIVADKNNAPAPAPAKQGNAASLRWEGPARVRAGASFDLALQLSSDQLVRTSPMQVRFDPAVLKAVGVRPGKALGSAASQGFGYRVQPDGSIFVSATHRLASAAANVELLVLVFKPIKSGVTAEVKVSALSLQDGAGRAIAHDALAQFQTMVTP